MRSVVSRKLVGLALLIMGQMFIVATIQDMIAQALHIQLSPQDVGLVMTTYGVTTMLGGFFFGRLTDKVGAMALLAFGLPTYVLTLIPYPLAHSSWQYVLVRVCNGIAYALVVNALFIMIRRSVSPEAQSRFTGILKTSHYAGSGIGQSMGLTLAANSPLLWSVVIGSGVGSVALVFSGLVLVFSPKVSLGQKAKEIAHKTFLFSVNFAKGSFNREAFFIALPAVGVIAGYSAFLTWLAVYVGEPAWKILLASTLANCATLFTVVPKVIESKGYRFVMGSSILILVGSLILIRIGGSFWLLLPAGVMVGVSIAGCSLSTVEGIYSQVNPGRLGVGLATSSFLFQLGGVIGISLSSLMWVRWGANMWIWMIPLLVVSLVLLFLIKPKPKAQVTFVRRENQLCCVRESAARAVMGKNEAQFIAQTSRMAALKEVSHGERLEYELDHIAFSFALLNHALRGLVRHFSLRQQTVWQNMQRMILKEMKLLEQRLEELLKERFDRGETIYDPQAALKVITRTDILYVEYLKMPVSMPITLDEVLRFLSAAEQNDPRIRLDSIVQSLRVLYGLEEWRPTDELELLEVAA